METLDGTDWDVVIAGTGLPQSLLALSLSRSGKKVLHLDKNDYYGGNEAALSLSEAEVWATAHVGENEADGHSAFSHASVEKPAAVGDVKLSHSRAYSLALAPQIIHTQSKLLAALVSSRTQNQLDFQAVGSWFVVEPPGKLTAGKITRVPSGREDIFQDTTFDLRAKRSLMNFLRFVGNYEEQPEAWQGAAELPFSAFLQQKFGLPPSSHTALLSLTLASDPLANTTTGFALPRIARHLCSIGLFGPGFGAVLPKWGGLAEIAQVACRAGAVGGAVYVLKKGIRSTNPTDNGKVNLTLSDGENVSTTWLAGSAEDLPSTTDLTAPADAAFGLTRSISIISSSLAKLFPPTSEGGVTPAGAVVVVSSADSSEPPVHILVHSSDSGECPSTQSVLYASVALPYKEGSSRLNAAVASLLESIELQSPPQALWSLQYYQSSRPAQPSSNEHILILPPLPSDIALPDQCPDEVKAAWRTITAEDEAGFLRFEAREGTEEED